MTPVILTQVIIVAVYLLGDCDVHYLRHQASSARREERAAGSAGLPQMFAVIGDAAAAAGFVFHALFYPAVSYFKIRRNSQVRPMQRRFLSESERIAPAR